MRNIMAGDVSVGSGVTPQTTGAYKSYPEIGWNTLTGNRGDQGAAVRGFANVGGARTMSNRGIYQGTAQLGGTGGTSLSPLIWWGVVLVLLVGLMWFARRFGSEKTAFHSIRLSIYNIFVIALAAAIGFGFFKMVFGAVRVDGLSDFFQAI